MQDTSCRAGERSPPPANPCTPATPSGLEASPLAAKLQLSEGPGGRGRGVRSRHSRPSREPQTRSARGLPAGWGLLRPSARSCPSAGSASPASPARRRGNATATAPPRRGARARGRGPYSPGPPPPPPPPPRRPIPAAGACRRAASLQSPPPAGPAPPPAQRLRSGPLLRPGLGRRRRSATWPPLRRLATPFRAREAERGRGAGGGGGGCAGGMCARGGREAGGNAPARACPRPRARGPPSPSAVGIPTPPPRPIPDCGVGAHARPSARPGRTFSPSCHNVSAQPRR